MTDASLESEESRGYFPGYLVANRYDLLRLLGVGGSGVVWAAHDRVLNLEVAVKLVRRLEAARDDFARRTQLEASSAARIAHPAVCRAIDFGLSAHGEPFVVSELLDGESLDDRIFRTGPLTATHAVRVLLPILDALRAAHEGGIVHRDVKPGNIFLARVGLRRLQPKLLDFGIACWLSDTATSEAGIWGTPQYMSPEQACGGEIDDRSDLWNFCATLYETLTGVVPFRGETCDALLLALQSEDPEPITTYGVGDDALSAIVLRGLERSRDARWQSASELGGELCRWLLDRGVETDICDHSLRARLLDPSRRESRHDTPHAHVLPRDATREASPPRKLLHAGGGTRRRPMNGIWTAIASATALVAALIIAVTSYLRASPVQASPLADLRATASLSPPRAATAGSPPRASAPQASAPVESTADGVVASVSIGAKQAAVVAGASPVSPKGPARTRQLVPATTSSNAASRSGVAPVPPEPARKQRATNALNYDFGF